MELYYQIERDQELLTNFEKIQKQHPNLSIRQIAIKAIKQPYSSFFISDYRIRAIVNMAQWDMKPTFKSPAKKALYHDIKAIYQQHSNSTTPQQICKIISDAQAPRLYISVSRAVRLYYKLVKERGKKNYLRIQRLHKNRPSRIPIPTKSQKPHTEKR